MKINLFKTDKGKSGGYSLVELVIYISILTIITGALVAVVVSVLGTFSKLKAYEEVAHSGTVVLERMSREIRRARTIDPVLSTFDFNPGELSLITTDLSGNATNILFSVSGNQVMIKEGSNTPSPISNSSVTVSNLSFTRIIGTNSEGVLINLTLEKLVRTSTTSRQFQTFVVLDG